MFKKVLGLVLALALLVGVAFAEDVSKTQEVYDPSVKLSPLACLIGDQAYVKIISGIGSFDVANLWTDFRYFVDVAKVKEINVLIMSPGGDGLAGLAISDEITRLTGRGIKVTAYASGLIASAAVPIFASCSMRYASPGTMFMVHEPELFKFLSSEKRADLRTQGEMMDILVDKYIGVLAKHSKLSKQEWEKKGLETTYFTAQQAFEWGLVDKIE